MGGVTSGAGRVCPRTERHAIVVVDSEPDTAGSRAGVGALQRGDVDLLHPHERLRHTAGPLRIGVAHQIDQRVGGGLPGQAEPVLEPAARGRLAAGREKSGPDGVDLLLRLARDKQRDRRGELEVRPPVGAMNPCPASSNAMFMTLPS